MSGTALFPYHIAVNETVGRGAWPTVLAVVERDDGAMKMDIQEMAPGVNRVVLDGRLDAAGTGEIELRFTASIAPADRHAVVDLAAVPFVSSLGIRLLLTVARTLHRRGRKAVILNPQPSVMTVFETVALGTLIPIATDEAEALALTTA